jgi:O-antigen ligase
LSQEAWWRPSYKGDREQERGEWENQRPRLSAYVAEHDSMGANPALALSPADPTDQEVLQTPGRPESHHPHLKWIALLLFAQCFLYKDTDFVPSLNVGVTVSPDRLISIIILMLAVWRLSRGELHFPSLGKVGWYMLLFAFICTASSFAMGTGSEVLYRLFDFNYNPLIIFLLAKTIPYNRNNLEFLTRGFLVVGAYLAINGIFERFGPHALVWPRYILDSSIGIQFGRTRGSFASSEALGQALAVCFLFYAFYVTRVKGMKLFCAYLLILVTSVVIYATNQRAAWISFGLCLIVLGTTKTDMKRISRLFLGVAFVAFLSGAGTHFSFWDETLFSRRQNTVSYRKVNFRTAIEMGKAHPLFGIGFGNFKNEWPKYFRPEGSDVRDLEDGNHNTFLGIFAEIGLIGLILYLIIFYYMLRAGLRVYIKGGEFERQFALVFLLVVVVYMFGGNFSDYRSGQFFNTSLYLLFGMVAAIEVHLASASQQPAEELSSGRLASDAESLWRDKLINSGANVSHHDFSKPLI